MRGQGLSFCGEVEDIAGCETSALLKDPSTGLPPLLEFGEISRGTLIIHTWGTLPIAPGRGSMRTRERERNRIAGILWD